MTISAEKPGPGRGRFAVLKRILIAITSAIIFWTIIIMLFEDKFIFFPSAYPSGPYEDIRIIPGATEHTITTEDGVTLHGVFSRSDSAIATVLFAHGNAGNLSHRFHWLRRMLPLSVNILMFDYRGYGKSEGSPTEAGVYADARAAYDHLEQLDEVHDLPVILWGRSLGGAVVVDLATHRQADGLILESTFTSAADMAASAYPFLPFIGHLITTRMDSRTKMASVQAPSFHIHGSEDAIVPPALGQQLYDAARGEKSLYIIEGAGHNDTYVIGGGDYVARIRAFLESVRNK